MTDIANRPLHDVEECTSTPHREVSHTRICDSCGEEGQLRRCSKCNRAWYCGVGCQKDAWRLHKYDCGLGRPLDSADYLVLDCYHDRMPKEPSVLNDFGFCRFDDLDRHTKILGLFIGLVVYLEVGDRTLHCWQTKGTLKRNITKAFSVLPESSRGGYFPWFLAHDWIFEPSRPEAVRDPLQALKLSNASLLDETDRNIAFQDLQPEAKQQGLIFYYVLRNGYHPRPGMPTWISLGFCTCRDEESEGRLAFVYRQLIGRCSFQDFWRAMDSSTMPNLLARYGMDQTTKTYRHFDTLMVRTSPCPSVWSLKAFCYGDESNPNLSVIADYGFMNCRNPEDRLELKSVYRHYFDRYEDEMELHAACCRGQLFQYLHGFQQIDPKFQALMRNLYPLEFE